MNNIRVRFAPSPTGYLHLGNIRTALFNWLWARNQNGTFILRIEDTDRERSREKYQKAIFEDMRWLGLFWDEGPDTGGEYGPYRQSLRDLIYQQYFQELKKNDMVYPCYCDSSSLAKRRQEALKKGKPPRYDGRCRRLTHIERNRYENEGRKPSWRFKVPDGTVSVIDVIRGQIDFDASLLGDFIVMRQDGTAAFNFAVTVDDICMKITHIIRGEDHLPNTPRHVLLYKALQAPLPVWAHIGLTREISGGPLSKRSGSLAVMEYKRQGYLPGGLLNYLALLGWTPGDGRELLNMEELIAVFSLNGLSARQSMFDGKKLDWVNSFHIQNMDNARLTDLCIPYLKGAGLIKGPVSENKYRWLEQITGIIKGNMITVGQCVGYMKMFLVDPVVIAGEEEKKIIHDDYVSLLLQTLHRNFAGIDKITGNDVRRVFKAAQKSLGIIGKRFYMPVRIALTGAESGPELTDIIPLLGKDKLLKRLDYYSK